jgi:hypothetical protein
VALPLRPGRSTLRAGALKRRSASFPDLASHFAAERAEPSTAHLLNGRDYFVRYEFNRPDSVALSRPLSLGVQKSPKLHQRLGFGLASAGEPIPNGHLCYANAFSDRMGCLVAPGRNIHGIRVALFSGQDQALTTKEAKFDQAAAANSSSSTSKRKRTIPLKTLATQGDVSGFDEGRDAVG